jgi:adhesin transport system outer membrane protein
VTRAGLRVAGLAGAVLLAAGCATAPPVPAPQSYVVLLPDPDGAVGRVVVGSAQGQAALDRPRQGARFDGSAPYAVDDAVIQKDFGAALAARPSLPVTFVLYYEAGTARLTGESQALIPRVLEAVRGRPAPDVSVIGHTDTAGAADANEKLGLERAQSVARLIQEAGLKAQELTVTSHGERNPLIRTPDSVDEPRNRRVEITVR